MQRFIHLIAVLFFLVMSTTANAQVTGTRLINKGTLLTGSLVLTGTQPTVLFTDQATEGVKGITTLTLFDAAGWGPLDTGVLTGLSLTGGLVSTTAQIRGLLTTSGVTSVTASISGTLTVSGLSSMTTLSATTLTTSGIGTFGGIVSTTGTYSGSLIANGLTLTGGIVSGTGTYSGAIIGNGLTLTGGIVSATGSMTGGFSASGITSATSGISIRNATAQKLEWGTVGSQFGKLDSTTLQSYFQNYGGSGIGFAHAGSTISVNLYAPVTGVLKVGDGTTGLGTLQTGGWQPNLRTTTTNGNFTLTDTTLTFSGAVTNTLVSAVGQTGRIFYTVNIGAVTGTITGTAGQTINGVTTQAILTGSSLGVQSDGTNYIIISR
mgnify:CR=1 FL=1